MSCSNLLAVVVGVRGILAFFWGSVFAMRPGDALHHGGGRTLANIVRGQQHFAFAWVHDHVLELEALMQAELHRSVDVARRVQGAGHKAGKDEFVAAQVLKGGFAEPAKLRPRAPPSGTSSSPGQGPTRSVAGLARARCRRSRVDLAEQVAAFFAMAGLHCVHATLGYARALDGGSGENIKRLVLWHGSSSPTR